MELLWPDEDPESTRLRFRQVLTTLRRELDPTGNSVSDLIIADRSDVRLNPRAVTTDVDEFEAELKHAARIPQPAERAELLQKAVDRYGGALLPGFYEDWISRERQRLSDEYQDALVQLADALASSGRLTQAIEYARKAVTADPIHEVSACCLMRNLAAAGRSSDALRHYRILEQALWRELRAAPAESTREMMEAIRSGAVGKLTAAEGTRQEGGVDGATIEGEIVPVPIGVEAGADGQRGALPVALNRFFGRDAEIDRLIKTLDPSSDELEHVRLITLVGPGGAGKTRLGLEGARRLHHAFHGAVWFVRLAGVTSGPRLRSAIVEALSPHDSSAPESLEQIIKSLGKSDGLLVLDNFEQLTDEGGPIVRSLLERAPGLRCLITSRQRLNIEGEQELSVPPLPIPDNDDSPNRVAECPSVRLFIDRSRRSRLDFALTDANSAAIGALCRRLEGIPLALELAAGWAGSLTPAQILDRLSQRFDLLVSRRKDLDERHRSLAATISWSYEQLSPGMQKLFGRLSVFRGGWTMEAAESVCSDEASSERKRDAVRAASFILDGLEHLRERSLIIAEPYGEQVRFRMLETLREFAEQNLTEDERRFLTERHARYFLSVAERGGRELTGPNQVEWLDGLDADIHNLRTAISWSFGDGGDVDLGMRLFGSIWRFWDIRGHRTDADWMWDQLHDKSDSCSRIALAMGLEGAGSLAVNNRDYAAGKARLNESLAIYRSEGDKAGIARTLCWLGLCLRDTGLLPEAREALHESLALAEQSNDRMGTASALAGLGGCANHEKNFTESIGILDRAGALFRICGHHRGLAWCMLTEGHSAVDHGDYVLAEQRFQEALALYRMIGDRTWIFLSLFFLAHLARTSGDLDLALTRGEEALVYARHIRSATWEASFLAWLGDLASDRNEPEEGWKRYREGLKTSEEKGIVSGQRSALSGMASLAARQGQVERAIRLFSAAMQLDAHPTRGAHLWYLRNHEEALTQLQQTSDTVLFESAWKRGQAMTPAQAIADAMSDWIEQ